ncbi:unnamed protein product [Owenia fusiformis]|uniref:Uncharacterized protein n=1 Tax=Owenia fusiformis TaxID=6347 RepID=A0A8J1XGH6_OWEFU|nr:unnamed protein product [Owenia fusiformis]
MYRVRLVLVKCRGIDSAGYHSSRFSTRLKTTMPQYYVIRSRLNGLVLDIARSNREPGAAVILWPETNNDNQLWYLDNGKIKSKLNDLVLDIKGGCSCPGTPVIMWHGECGKSWQQWHVECDGTIKSELCGLVLDVKQSNREHGAELIAYCHHGGCNQQWDLLPRGSGGCHC